MFAACGVKKEELRLEALGENGALISGVNPALGENGALISGVNPCGTEEEVRKAGIPLSEEPFGTQSDEEKGLESVTYLVQDEKFAFELAGCEVKSSFFQFVNGKLDEEKGLESVTYLVQDEKFAFELAGCEVKSSFFQFVNGKLSNITMELPDGVSYETVNQEMIALYGEPVNGEKVDERSAMTVWEFPGEYPVRAAVIGRLEEEQLVVASFQISYVWFGEELFSLEELRNENGDFQYKDIPFGSSSEEVLGQIPAELEKMEAIDSAAVSYYTKEKFEFYGCDATLFLEFDEDKLDAVQVHFPVKEGEGQFQEILDELTGLYGEADEVTDEGGELFTSEIYLWGKDTDAARLQAMLLKTKSDVSVSIAVFARE